MLYESIHTFISKHRILLYSSVIYFSIALPKAKQPEIAALLSQADFNISTQQFYNDVYEAMAHSLGEAWRDLNRLLEKRKQLLEDAVNFHKNINDVSAVTI